ncbi:MAG TPA: ParB/RepB/Spo0J family partition protein [Methanocella sp.]|nr:ParB/RepB/Spo0J family partition protein [Methanocella sp.]
MIPIARVKFDKSHIRKSDFSLRSLKSTIEDAGLLQPILARRNGDGFTVVDGARRLAALIELGVTELIVGRDLIIDVEETEADARFKQIIANVQREDLNPIEMGNAFVALKEEFGYQYNETAEIIGRTPHYVASKVGLAKRLDPGVQKLYIEDLEREKCIRNTELGDAEPGYLMNINVLEDIARLPVELQKPAYEEVRAEEMDKAKALRYLKSLKKAAAAADGKVTFAMPDGRVPSPGIQRHIRKISRDIERLLDSVHRGERVEHDVVPEIERLIEKLSTLCIRIKVKDFEVAEGAHG